MLKTIPVMQARKGMYVHKFCGSWIDHPFWGRRLLIADNDQLRQIQGSRISELIIDLSRGVDVAAAEGDASVAAVQMAAQPHQQNVPDGRPGPMVFLEPTRCSLTEELDRARVLVAHGKQAILTMFADVRMGRAVTTEGLAELIDDMSDSVGRNPHALISMARIKHKDEYTYLHSVAVAALMVALARRYGCTDEQVRVAGLAGLLHDLGKAMMPEAILNKPSKLTADEMRIMQAHPSEGFKLLQQWQGIPDEVRTVCLHHHEKLDGTGYPAGQSGQQIELMARMGAICDVYDAITSNRPYKKGWDPAESLRQMSLWKGHFDPELFRLFVHILGIYPVGSLVRLSSDRLAVVIEQGANSLLTPRLSVFYSVKLRQKIAIEHLDLADAGVTDRIVGRESPEDWAFGSLDRLWQ